MARTKKIELFYNLTQNEIIPPSIRELERKDKFIAEVKKTVKSNWEPEMIRVTYERFNPDIDKLRKFFHTCVKYYAIQNMDLFDRLPSTEEFNKYREEILDELLGYDFQTVNKVVRKRESTSNFKDTESWNTLLKTLEETLFEHAGYEFPDSKVFWENVEKYGHGRTQDAAIKNLQNKLTKKQ